MLIGMTEEQEQLRDVTRALMSDIAAEATVRRLMATEHGHQPEHWAMLGELGLLGLAAPVSVGGGGGSLVDQGIVLEEMGKRLHGGPYFSSAVLAVQVLLRQPETALVADLLRAVCSGSTLCTVATGRTAPLAERSGVDWTVTGTLTHVPDGALAEWLVVLADSTDGPTLLCVDLAAPGVHRTWVPTMDQTRHQATIHLTRAAAESISRPGAGAEPFRESVAVAGALLASEQVGGVRAVLDLVLAHVHDRHQFGRPIGSFQVIQHTCATMLVELEAARSAAYYARAAAAFDWPDWQLATSAAKVYCSEVYRHTTDRALQIFGGIGLTWEHPIHLYLKRARSSEVFLGSPNAHREMLAQLLSI